MDTFLPALIFGALLACSVGPIALLIVNTGVSTGTAAALRCAGGAALADLAYAVAAFAGGAMIADWLAGYTGLLAVIAGAVLIAFGAWMAWPAFRPVTLRPAKAVGFRGTFLLTMTNPLTLLTFAAFSMSMSMPGHWVIGALGVGLGSLAVQVLLALAGGSLRRWLQGGPLPRLLQLGSGVGIAAFGVFKILA